MERSSVPRLSGIIRDLLRGGAVGTVLAARVIDERGFRKVAAEKRSRSIDLRARRGQTAERIRLDAQRNCDLICRAVLWFGASDAPAVYGADEVRQCGIYLWTVPLAEGYLTYYVGETGSSFNERLRQHYMEHVAARYHVYSAQKFARGEKFCLWPGRYDPTNIKTDEECRDIGSA